ncbi:MAG: DUF4251 domain-containing protein [Algicola sp.]|nr:DUF4251 domain-containing protein [Algicola sp.]
MKSTHKSLLILIFFGLLLMSSCNSSKSKATPEQLNRLSELIYSKNFEITSDMAYPQVSSGMVSLQSSGLIPQGSSVNQINLIGNVNYLRVVGDSIYAELPYFGERQMNAGYNGSDSSIIIENVLQNYTVEKNSNDNSYSIGFNAKTERELLRFNITVFPNLSTSMLVNGPTRTPIRYSGTVIKI